MRVLFLIFSFLYSITIPKEFGAKFVQTIQSKNSNITYKGRVYLLNNEIVWKYSYPNKKTIWVKDKIIIYEPDLEQVTITKKKFSLIDIIKKAKQIKPNLYKAIINNKKIFFVYKNGLKRLYYKDEFGNNINIIFFKLNKIDKKAFEINLPKDVDIITQ